MNWTYNNISTYCLLFLSVFVLFNRHFFWGVLVFFFVLYIHFLWFFLSFFSNKIVYYLLVLDLIKWIMRQTLKYRKQFSMSINQSKDRSYTEYLKYFRVWYSVFLDFYYYFVNKYNHEIKIIEIKQIFFQKKFKLFRLFSFWNFLTPIHISKTNQIIKSELKMSYAPQKNVIWQYQLKRASWHNYPPHVSCQIEALKLREKVSCVLKLIK